MKPRERMIMLIGMWRQVDLNFLLAKNQINDSRSPEYIPREEMYDVDSFKEFGATFACFIGAAQVNHHTQKALAIVECF